MAHWYGAPSKLESQKICIQLAFYSLLRLDEMAVRPWAWIGRVFSHAYAQACLVWWERGGGGDEEEGKRKNGSPG